MAKTMVGVIGPGDAATAKETSNAYELGKLIAAKGWVTLCGGRDQGVMNAVCKGAKENDGITLGILPSDDEKGLSGYADKTIQCASGEGIPSLRT